MLDLSIWTISSEAILRGLLTAWTPWGLHCGTNNLTLASKMKVQGSWSQISFGLTAERRPRGSSLLDIPILAGNQVGLLEYILQ